jgi:hypothetical protein
MDCPCWEQVSLGFYFQCSQNRFLGTLFFDEKDPNVGWDYIYLILFITSIIISLFTLLFCVIDCLKMRKQSTMFSNSKENEKLQTPNK